MPKKIETLFKEKKFDLEKYRKYFPELKSESPRVVAIVGCSFIDIFLNDYLKMRLIDDKNIFKRIDNLSFERRVDLCYLTGIIGKMELNDYSIMGEIRNRFAHNISINSFDEKEIAARCNKLEILKLYQGKKGFPMDTPKEKFVLALYEYLFVLQVKRNDVNKIESYIEVLITVKTPEGEFDLII